MTLGADLRDDEGVPGPSRAPGLKATMTLRDHPNVSAGSSEPRRDLPPLPARRAWWIAGAHAVVASAWIFLSDRALLIASPDPELLVRWSVAKGLFYVGVTSLLLLLVLRSAFRATAASHESLRARTRQLQASEELLGSIFGSARDAIIATDGASRIVLCNQAAERLFGLPKSEALGCDLRSLLPEFPRAERVHASDGSDLPVLQARRSDGSIRPVEASIARLGEGDGALQTIVLRDVSRRLQQQAEIERLQRLHEALSGINQAIATMPARHELLQRTCRVLVEQGGFRLAWIGWHQEETALLVHVAECGDEQGYLRTVRISTGDAPSGRGPSGTAFREDRPYICNDVETDPSTLELREEALRHGFRSCASFPIHLRGRPCGVLSVYAGERDVFLDKEISVLAAAAADLSLALEKQAGAEERLHAEAEARREREFSVMMIESMPGVVYFYDDRGQFLRWNRSFEAITGYSATEIATMHPLQFFDQGETARQSKRMAEAFESGESSTTALLRAKDGTTTPYYFTGRRVDHGGRSCLVGVGIDISERMRAETALRELADTLEQRVTERTAELEEALVRAESADKLKSAFLATMSHELRTPLNSIMGFTGIILMGLAGPLTEEQSRQLGMVQGSARHLLSLINDILDISRIEAGQIVMHSEPFPLRDILDRVAETVRPLADAKGLDLGLEAPAGLGEVNSDRRRVEQILLNLLNNAVKFTERGGACLMAESGSPGDDVRIRVIDTGPGIGEEELPMLFQPFRQLDSGLMRQHEGSGLGLAISRRLAELLGGSITVTSEVGKGSEFTLMLPRQPPGRHA